MAFHIAVPTGPGTSLEFDLEIGQTVFALGANGTGKSSLLQALYGQHRGSARRISAHRQTWLASNLPAMSAEQRRQFESNMRTWDSQPQARWYEESAQQRPLVAIFDLIESENGRARRITAAVDGGDVELAKRVARDEAPIKVINDLLRLSSISIVLSVDETQGLLASKSGGPPYGVAKLSDGERNALLIAASVLTAPAGTLLLLDEPERHLHRSIISPMLTLLLAKRPDCAFVISTHDVMLPLDNPDTRTLLLRGCTCQVDNVVSWNADLLPAGTELDDVIRRDILGARQRILFIEGRDESLDKPLYSLVFPNVSVIAKASCRDVEHAVLGIRGSHALHWLRAFGIVDGDGRVPSEVEELRAKGVYALQAFSVESIYYDAEIQRRAAERHAAVVGGDPTDRLESAKAAALEAIVPHADRLSARAAEKECRHQVMSQLPGHREIAAHEPINISVDTGRLLADARAQLDACVTSEDLTKIVRAYPIRETPALDQIVRHLAFKDRAQYEATVRKLLMVDGDALAYVRSLFGTLPAEIDAA